MQKKIINYYSFIMMILFVIYNVILKDLKIGGLLYVLFMIILSIFNIKVILKYSKDIKYKKIFIIIFCIITVLLSRNGLQYIFGIINVLILIIVCYKEKILGKEIFIIGAVVITVLGLPLLFNFLLRFGASLSTDADRQDIYEDMHYYCENNYEVYGYSMGAMDKMHYSIGKHYDILNINDIIYITYNKRNEVSQEKYDKYLDTHKCTLVGE